MPNKKSNRNHKEKLGFILGLLLKHWRCSFDLSPNWLVFLVPSFSFKKSFLLPFLFLVLSLSQLYIFFVSFQYPFLILFVSFFSLTAMFFLFFSFHLKKNSSKPTLSKPQNLPRKPKNNKISLSLSPHLLHFSLFS